MFLPSPLNRNNRICSQQPNSIARLRFGSDILSTPLANGSTDTVELALELVKRDIELDPDKVFRSVHLAANSRQMPQLLQASLDQICSPQDREVISYTGDFQILKNFAFLTFKDKLLASNKSTLFIVLHDLEQFYSDQSNISIHGSDQSLSQLGAFEKGIVGKLQQQGKTVIFLSLCNKDKSRTGSPSVLLQEMRQSQLKTRLIEI